MDELELFTVAYRENGTIGVDFNEQLLQVVAEEELIKKMTPSMGALRPIVVELLDYISGKSEVK